MIGGSVAVCTDSPERLVAAAPQLQALPVVAQRLLAVLHADSAAIDSIARLLGTDQALASAVLRHANCGLDMPVRRIASLTDAVTRIGHVALMQVLLRACAGPMLDRGLPAYAMPRAVAWRHAATTSVAARTLAQLAPIGLADEAGIAGLLHDVGKNVLTSVVPEAAAKAVSLARGQRLPVWQAEEQVLGFSHAEVGAVLLRSWGLPENVVDAVARHHQPARASGPLATVVYLADAAAHVVGAVGSGGACPQPALDMQAAQNLGVTAEQIDAFLTTLQCVEQSRL